MGGYSSPIRTFDFVRISFVFSLLFLVPSWIRTHNRPASDVSHISPLPMQVLVTMRCWSVGRAREATASCSRSSSTNSRTLAVHILIFFAVRLHFCAPLQMQCGLVFSLICFEFPSTGVSRLSFRSFHPLPLLACTDCCWLVCTWRRACATCRASSTKALALAR